MCRVEGLLPIEENVLANSKLPRSRLQPEPVYGVLGLRSWDLGLRALRVQNPKALRTSQMGRLLNPKPNALRVQASPYKP